MRQDTYMEQALDFSNVPLIDRRIKASVHLEDTDDIPFWDHHLQDASPGEYNYICFSKNSDGNDTRGCEQCLRFRGYLNERFFICIDSDLRLICSEPGLDAGHLIAQTHSYSWENHTCEAEHLQARLTSVISDPGFDFKTFLTNLSDVIYGPLLAVAYCRQQGSPVNQQWNISKFNACIPLQPDRSILENNGETYIANVQRLLAEAMVGAPEVPEGFGVGTGVNPQNAYLHMQGHHLVKLVYHIGKMICHGRRVSFWRDVLDKKFPDEGYQEVDNLRDDLIQIVG